VGDDRVQANAQDGGGVNNANFLTFGNDGSIGRVQMYIWTGPNPNRDGDFDNEIVIHEMAHGLSIRLHGGLSGIQRGGMGEGWGDFLAFSMLAEPGDDPDGVYAMGAYATHAYQGTFQNNYYFGIRRFPCSTDMTKSPLTYADIDSDQFHYDPSIPRGAFGSSN